MVSKGHFVRIIAGLWRGRRLPVLDAAGLRPTKDQVRETLFNWIGPDLPGARCLDLFAGTGALGFEAASRGAVEVLLVEKDRKVASQLKANADMLKTTVPRIHNQSAQDCLEQLAGEIDVAFVDPPFALDVLGDLLPVLVAKMHVEGAIYIEQDRTRGLPVLPEGWHYHREKSAGQVVFGLAVKSL
jgi:16S rRNA (guanine966-N2)-methyltransferase